MTISVSDAHRKLLFIQDKNKQVDTQTKMGLSIVGSWLSTASRLLAN